MANSTATGLSLQQITAVTAASDAVSSLSIVGSWCIVIAFIKFRHLRSLAFLCVFILSLCDVGNQASNLFSPSSKEVYAMTAQGAPISAQCVGAAISDSFFELSSVMWTTAIAALLYMSVFLRATPELQQRRMRAVGAFCFGLPLLLTLLPLSESSSYGPAGAWCWITDSRVYWRYIQFYVPLWCAVAFNCVVYYRVTALLRGTSMRSAQNDAMAARMRRITARLQWYPVILIVVWLPATVNRLYEAITGRELFWLFLLQRCFSSSQGLFNAIAYGLSDGVRQAIAQEALLPLARCFHCGRAVAALTRDKGAEGMEADAPLGAAPESAGLVKAGGSPLVDARIISSSNSGASGRPGGSAVSEWGRTAAAAAAPPPTTSGAGASPRPALPPSPIKSSLVSALARSVLSGASPGGPGTRGEDSIAAAHAGPLPAAKRDKVPGGAPRSVSAIRVTDDDDDADDDEER